jgi:alkylation response protein AidB-like acyl-CoA dehydrogenase
MIWNQEEAKYKTPPNIFAIGQGMLGPTIMVHGTDEQKKRYLRPMLRGEEIWCQLFSEPAAGSDLGGLRTTAVRDGDDWIINGQKIWTTGATYCKWGMVLTRTDPNAPKHRGITYFIVDMQSPGIEIRPIKQINGAASFNEVFFTDVRVSDKNRVGAINEGWRGAITTLMNERAAIGGGMAGGPGFGDLVRLVRETDWGGRPAIEDSAVRQQLAQLYIRMKGLQYTSYRTQTALSRGSTPGPEASIGKLVGAPLRQQIAKFAVDVQGQAGAMGGDGAPQDAVWQLTYLGTPGLRLAGGTDEILRNIIAERILGLPPEVRVDKDLPFKEIPINP